MPIQPKSMEEIIFEAKASGKLEKRDFDFLKSSLQIYAQQIINDLETNPNEDGSQSPNIQHWIEQKKIQLRNKYIK